MLVVEKLKCLGGRLPVKDQSPRKVREAQEGYCRLLRRCNLLYKNLLCAFFSPEIPLEMSNIQSRQQERTGNRTGPRAARERQHRLSLGWQAVCSHPLWVPEIINTHCHSCFSGCDFIQSLQKLRIKCHGFVFGEAKLPPNKGALHTAERLWELNLCRALIINTQLLKVRLTLLCWQSHFLPLDPALPWFTFCFSHSFPRILQKHMWSLEQPLPCCQPAQRFPHKPPFPK